MGPDPEWLVFLEKKFKDKYTEGELHVNITEIWVMHVQAKEQQWLLAKHKKLEKRQGIDTFSQLSEGTIPANTTMSDL